MEKRRLYNVANLFSLQSLAYQALPSHDRDNVQKTIPGLPDTMKDAAKEVHLGLQIIFNQNVNWQPEDHARAVGFATSSYRNPIGYDIEGPNIYCTILDFNLQGENDLFVDFKGTEIPTIQSILNELNKICYQEISLASVEEYKVWNFSKYVHCGSLQLRIRLFVEDGLDLQQVIQFCYQSEVWQWQNLHAASKFQEHFSKVLGRKITLLYVHPFIAFDTSTEKGMRQLVIHDMCRAAEMESQGYY